MKKFKHVFLVPAGDRKIYIEGYLAGVDGEVTIDEYSISGLVYPEEILFLPLETENSRVRDFDGWTDCQEDLILGVLGQVIEPICLAVHAKTRVQS